MKWLELSVRTPSEYVEPLSHLFSLYGEGAVVIENVGGYDLDDGHASITDDLVTVLTYLPQNSTTSLRQSHIDLGLRLLAHVASISPLKERMMEADEWSTAWKKHFHVLRIGQRTVIVPSWLRYDPAEQDAVILLDPGMAFGTGYHPTTKMCLEELENRTIQGKRVLDVGCGSGILCIAASKYGAETVVGLDKDPMAIEVAKANLDSNSIVNATLEKGSVPHPIATPKSFDLVVANISAVVILELVEDLVGAAKVGGHVIVSGFLEEKMAYVAERLTSAGTSIDRRIIEDDWVLMVASVVE